MAKDTGMPLDCRVMQEMVVVRPDLMDYLDPLIKSAGDCVGYKIFMEQGNFVGLLLTRTDGRKDLAKTGEYLALYDDGALEIKNFPSKKDMVNDCFNGGSNV